MRWRSRGSVSRCQLGPLCQVDRPDQQQTCHELSPASRGERRTRPARRFLELAAEMAHGDAVQRVPKPNEHAVRRWESLGLAILTSTIPELSVTLSTG